MMADQVKVVLQVQQDLMVRVQPMVQTVLQEFQVRMELKVQMV